MIELCGSVYIKIRQFQISYHTNPSPPYIIHLTVVRIVYQEGSNAVLAPLAAHTSPPTEHFESRGRTFIALNSLVFNVQYLQFTVMATLLCRHPASGYVQGINDLVTPFLAVFLAEHFESGQSMQTWDLSLLAEERILEVESTSCT